MDAAHRQPDGVAPDPDGSQRVPAKSAPTDPTDWPAPIVRAVEATAGAVAEVHRQFGLGARPVLRVDGPRGSVILKIDAHPRERRVYTTCATRLAAAGVPIPDLLLARTIDSTDWLVLEHIPRPLPRERWLADPAVLGVLGRLHDAAGVFDDLDDPFRPVWPTAANEAAASLLGPSLPGGFEHLERLRAEATPWLGGPTPISGDPNPRNWGVRMDGQPVLFDWERAGVGHGVVDLAITIPGLPSSAAAHRVLAARPGAGHVPPSSEMTRGMLLAKAWTIVELLAASTDTDELGSTQSWLEAEAGPWLATL